MGEDRGAGVGRGGENYR
uniref:Uncharacterized protein n=1 Tax=Arundo donax TaxID=35708 RepID=A0A0A9HHH0_ARUDO